MTTGSANSAKGRAEASEWEEVRLGELLRVEHGFAFKGEYFADSGPTVLLTPKNFLPAGGLTVSAPRLKYYNGPMEERFVLSAGDVVVAMTDLKQDAPILGSTGVVPDGGPYLHNQRIGKVLVKDPRRLEHAFLPWLLNSPGVRQRIRATATGATVRHTAPERIQAAVAPLPSPTTQRRIAAVLAAFDRLIEINERRIELLQTLAGLLYREWFVRFRFPGERADLVDSALGPIPSGWRAVPLGEVVTLRYGRSLPATRRLPGAYPVVSSAGVIGEHVEPLVSGPGVVVGRKGNVGSVWWIRESFFPIDTTYYVDTDAPLGLVYWQLRDLMFIDSHAAVPGLSREQAYALNVLEADEALAQRFDAFHQISFELIGTLRAQNRALARTRDLLLPRLVTGSLDISDIDLGHLLWPERE